MAAASAFETGRLTDVWVPAGKDSLGNVRYRRAQFDVLLWDISGTPETFVVPLGLERAHSVTAQLVQDHAANFGQEFGYYSADSIVVEPHTADGLQDSVLSLHTFGPV